MKTICMLLCAATASASVITSGTIEVHGLNSSFTSGSFAFSGDSFAVTGTFWDGKWFLKDHGPRYQSGQSGFSGGGLYGPLTFLRGTATVDGTIFSLVDWSYSWDHMPLGTNSFEITGAPVTVGSAPGIYQSTFSMAGSLCGTTSYSSVSPPCAAFLPNLTGQGVVQATFAADGVFQGNPLFIVTDLLYTFSAPQAAAVANPEPATWLLLLLGYGAVMAYARAPFSRVSSFKPAHVERAQ